MSCSPIRANVVHYQTHLPKMQNLLKCIIVLIHMRGVRHKKFTTFCIGANMAAVRVQFRFRTAALAMKYR